MRFMIFFFVFFISQKGVSLPHSLFTLIKRERELNRDIGVESGGGASSVVKSSVDVAVRVVTVDGKEDRGSRCLGVPKSLSDSEGLTNRGRD